MRDAYDARMWAEHHQSFTGAIGELARATMAAMTKLNEIQFEAPWRAQPRGRKGHPPRAVNTDQPVASDSRSSASEPNWELPRALRPGDQTAIDASPGTIARMPPPTPDLPGMPTRNANSPDPS